jgi:hypothetical protein
MAMAGLDEEEKKGRGEEYRLEEILTTLCCNQNSIKVLGLVWFGFPKKEWQRLGLRRRRRRGGARSIAWKRS